VRPPGHQKTEVIPDLLCPNIKKVIQGLGREQKKRPEKRFAVSTKKECNITVGHNY
jgi:hypothetical protein